MSEEKKSKKKLVVIVAVVLAVIATGVIALKFNTKPSQSSNPESTLTRDYF